MQESVRPHRPLRRLACLAAGAIALWILLASTATQGELSPPRSEGGPLAQSVRADTDSVGLYQADSLLSFIRTLGVDSLRALVASLGSDSSLLALVDAVAPIAGAGPLAQSVRADTDSVALHQVDSLLSFIRALGADSLRALVRSLGPDSFLVALVDSLAPPDTNYRAQRYLTTIRRQQRMASLFPREQRSFLPGFFAGWRHQITLDSTGSYYTAQERVADLDVRYPLRLDRTQFRAQKLQSSLDRNWRELISQRAAQRQRQRRGGLGLSITVPGGRNSGFTTIFGKNEVDLQVTGNADIRPGFDYQKSDQQLVLGQAARLYPSFKMDLRLGVTGTIGDKMQVGVDWDTQRDFDYQNQLKLQYTGYEDEILQSIEAGHVFLQTPSSLIRGGQSLFGLKSEVHVGGFRLTTVASQQEGKSNNLSLEGGAELTMFNSTPTEYDDRTHYFLSYYFRNRWEEALSDPPDIILDAVYAGVTDIEVWKLTPVSPEEQNVRQIVALVDLGEPAEIVTRADGFTEALRPDEDIDQYSDSELEQQLRPGDAVPKDYLESGAMDQSLTSVDYQIGQFKKLTVGRDYDIDRLLGFITLNGRLQESEALAVSFRYLARGAEVQVGDFSSETGGGDNSQTGERIVLKLLKPVNLQQPANIGEANELNPAAWYLEMRNVYRLGRGLLPTEFLLDIVYEPPGRSATKTLVGITGQQTLIQVLGLDRLNEDGAKKPDDLFDFLNNYSINPGDGLLMFPYLEPFGARMAALINQSGLPEPEKETARQQFVFSDLYRKKRANAARNTQLDVYRIQGSFKGGVPSFYDLKAYAGLVQGSVRVTSGGVDLNEGPDYIVDYQGGTVTIVNQAYVTAGRDIAIDFEENSLVNFQKKTLLGARLDFSTDARFAVGGTIMRMSQKSLTDKFRIGEEPISNMIWGVDGQLDLEPRWLTRAIDAVPLLQTKEPSSISVSGEFAQLRPGHTLTNAFKDERRNLRKDGRDFHQDEIEGISYVDDFEGFENVFSLNRAGAWLLSSSPVLGSLVEEPGPEIDLGNNTRGGTGWYQLNASSLDELGASADPAVQLVSPQHVFPNREASAQERILTTLDMFFTPHERGPYNYSMDLGAYLDDPQRAWGGMTQRLSEGNTDFTTKNIEFVEFVFQPFTAGSESDPGARLMIDLGRISEDVIPDNKLNTEDGLSLTDGGPVAELARLSTGQQNQVINPIKESDRITEDLGLDGLASFPNNKFEQEGGLGTEQEKFADFLSALNSTSSARFPQFLEREKAKALRDPSGDDYHYFLDDQFFGNAQYYPDGASVQQRFTRFFASHELNSYDAQSKLVDAKNSRGNSRIPDTEDINLNSASDTDNSYYQYELPLSLSMLDELAQPDRTDDYVINEIEDQGGGGTGWYLVRIPVKDFSRRAGGIQDFTLIESIRVWTTGHTEPITLRFATLELVGSQWRTSEAVSLLGDDDEELLPEDPLTGARVSIESINNEENTIYEIPKGAVRSRHREVQSGAVRDAREQSMVMRVENVKPGRQQAVFYTYSSAEDFLKYKNLRMFVHLDGFVDDRPLVEEDRGDLIFFMRLGANETNDFYEYAQPLTPSRLDMLPEESSMRSDYLWRTNQANPDLEGAPVLDLNSLNIELSALNQLKFNRDEFLDENGAPFDATKIFWSDEYGTLQETVNAFAPPGARIGVKGTPSLARINTLVMGVRNPAGEERVLTDVNIWVNELRVSGYDENTGIAALLNADIELADLARIKGTLRAQTDGFADLASTLGERTQVNIREWTINTQVNMDKFVPERFGWSLPLSMEVKSTSSTPRFDPNRGDVRVTSLLNAVATDSTLSAQEISARQRDISEQAQTLKKTQSYTARINKTGSRSRLLRNTVDGASFRYSFSNTEGRSPSRVFQDTWRWTSTVGYRLTVRRPRVLRPFGFLGDVPVARILSGLSLNYLPTSLDYSLSANRSFSESKQRPDPVRARNSDLPLDVEFPVRPQHRFAHTRRFSLQYNPFGFLILSMETNTSQSLNEIGVDTVFAVILVDSLGAQSRLEGATLRALVDEGALDSAQIGVSAFELTGLQSIGFRDVFSRAINTKVTAGPTVRPESYTSRFGATFRPRLQRYRSLNWIQFQDFGYNANFSWNNGSVGNNTGARASSTVALRAGLTVRPKTLFDKFGFYKKLVQHQRAAKNAADARRAVRAREREQIHAARRAEADRREAERAGVELPEEAPEDEEDVEQDTTRAGGFRIPFLDDPLSVLRRAFLAVTGVKEVSVTYTGARRSDATNVGRLGDDGQVLVNYSLRDALFSGHGPSLRYRLGIERGIDPATDRVITDRLQVTDALTNSNRYAARTTFELSRRLRINLSWDLENSDRENLTYRLLDDGSPGADTTRGGDNSVSVWAFGASYLDLFTSQLNQFRSDCGTDCDADGQLPDTLASTVLTNEVVYKDFLSSYLAGAGRSLGGSVRVPFPMPKWQINYSGISTWPVIRWIAQSATLRHNYSADLSTDFRSNLRGGESDAFNLGGGPTIAFLIPAVEIDAARINERFQPLVALDLSFKGNVQSSVSWNTSNTYSLSTTNNVVSETRTSELSMTASYSTTKLKIPFIKSRLNNRINFSLTLSRTISDDRSFYIRRAIEAAALDPAFKAGDALAENFVDVLTNTTRYQASPKIAYQFSNLVSADVFVQYEDFIGDSRRLPYTSIEGGFNLRVNFAH